MQNNIYLSILVSVLQNFLKDAAIAESSLTSVQHLLVLSQIPFQNTNKLLSHFMVCHLAPTTSALVMNLHLIILLILPGYLHPLRVLFLVTSTTPQFIPSLFQTCKPSIQRHFSHHTFFSSQPPYSRNLCYCPIFYVGVRMCALMPPIFAAL